MATYAGQNAGAGKTDRIRQGVRSATFIGSIYSVLACIVLTLFGGVIPLLFVDASGDSCNSSGSPVFNL